MPNLFPRENRLTQKCDYQAVFSGSRRVSVGSLLILFRKTKNPHARLGLAVSKKSIPLACQRNRFKRLIREYFRLHPLSSCDMVVLCRRGMHELSNAEITVLFEKAWLKIERL